MLVIFEILRMYCICVAGSVIVTIFTVKSQLHDNNKKVVFVFGNYDLFAFHFICGHICTDADICKVIQQCFLNS